MFQTEPILFLQSFSTDLLDVIFIIITSLGDRDVVQFLLIAVIFGVDFRKGFVLLHMAVWTAFATGMLKDFFALPRPYYIDSAVRAIGRNITDPTPLKGMGAATFWGLPDDAAIEYVRMHRMGSFGFPSGHTSGATALWGGLLVLFQKKWLMLFCALLMVLIPLSRLYLGRHFIADVFGGYILGGFLLAVIYFVFAGKSGKYFLYFKARLLSFNRQMVLLPAYLFGLPLVFMLIFPAHPAYPALMLGLNLGFFMVRLKGLPEDSGSVPRRIMRVIIAGVIFLMTGYVFDWLRLLMPDMGPFFSFTVYPVLFMACFAWIASETNILLGLMKRQAQ